MRNHTLPKIHELVSTAGKNPSLTPGSSAQTAVFLLNNVPTGKEGKFWYYVLSLVIQLTITVDQPAMGGTAINADKLWKIIQSVQVQCPILGTLYTHSNTRGSVLGNIIQYFGFGYNALPVRPQIAAADGDNVCNLYYRVPFSYEFLRKPHETAPWGGFLEAGTVEVKLDVNNVLDGDSTGCLTKTASVRAWLEMVPSPEPVIHVPCHWREHITPGASTRHTITDMGSADGLQGIDMNKGVGIASLLNLTDATGIGLSGSDGVDNITGVDIPWRDQNRIDAPQAFMAAFHGLMGNQRRGKPAAPVTSDTAGFPYTIADTEANHPIYSAQALFFPLIAPGRDMETSKFQTVQGAKDINFSYTSTPASSNRFVGHYFATFEESFLEALARRIHPQGSGQVMAKTLNKQAGIIHGVGKAAYVRAKVLDAR